MKPKIFSVLFFADVIRIFMFLEKIKINVAPWRFWFKLFRTGFTFAVTLIQYEKIKVELVTILVGHPVDGKKEDEVEELWTDHQKSRLLSWFDHFSVYVYCI